jgi:hypothetical protein
MSRWYRWLQEQVVSPKVVGRTACERCTASHEEIESHRAVHWLKDGVDS